METNEKLPTFAEFASSIYPGDNKISEDTSIPDKYLSLVNKLADKFRDNGDKLVENPYRHIQEALKNTDIDDIESMTDDGEIPDGIMNTLAMNIYGGLYNAIVDTDQKAIINALTAYIIISSNSKEEKEMANDTLNPADVIKNEEETAENEIIDAELNGDDPADEADVEVDVKIPDKLDCIGFTACGIDSIPVRLFKISEAEITRYLTNNVLHFPVLASYDRYDGIPGMPYVIMKVAIPAKYAIERREVGNSVFADMVRKDGANTCIKKSLFTDIKPFRFPKYVTDGSILSMPEERDLMIRRGVAGDDLINLIKFSKPCVSRDNMNDYVCIYLRPERIIAQMLSDKFTGKAFGDIIIEGIQGGCRHQDTNTTDPIVWDVVLDCRRDPNAIGNYDVDLEVIFRNAITD